MAQAHIRQWRIGEATVSRIVEVYGFEDDIAVLLQGTDAEWLKSFSWLAPHFATPAGRMILSFQAFVVATPSRRIMVDTCIGNDRKTRFDVFTNLQTTFLEDLEAVGCPAQTIDTVLCTHLHFDHVGWNTRLVDGKWVPTFPQARYLLSREEAQKVQALCEAGDAHGAHYSDTIAPILNDGLADFIDVSQAISPEITLESTPGHTQGHVSVRVRSKGESAVITGDLMHHPVQCAVPERMGNFDENPQQAAQTRKEFLQRLADTGTLVIGSHFAEPTAGWVVRSGASWRFEPDTRPSVTVERPKASMR